MVVPECERGCGKTKKTKKHADKENAAKTNAKKDDKKATLKKKERFAIKGGSVQPLFLG